MGQYALWLSSWGFFLWLDWQKALLFVIVPQLHGLHWLLATNYLQHAHADGRPLSRAQRNTPGIELNYARNFEGLVNPCFLILACTPRTMNARMPTGPN